MNFEISIELARALYIGATVLFILTLGGLSNQETSRRGNQYGIAAMIIAITATILGPQVTANYSVLVILMLLGGSLGLILSKRVKMTEMPELVAILHSLVCFLGGSVVLVVCSLCGFTYGSANILQILMQVSSNFVFHNFLSNQYL